MIVQPREMTSAAATMFAQRDVGEAAIRIKPFGGAQDRVLV